MNEVCGDSRTKKKFSDLWPASEFAGATTEEIEIKSEYECEFVSRARSDIDADPTNWLRPVFEIFLGDRLKQLQMARSHLVARGCGV
jgi:hypothetical protein